MNQLWSLFPYFKPYLRKMIVSFLLLIAGSLGLLLQPKLAQYAVDLGIAQGLSGRVILFAAGIFLDAILSSGCLYTSGVLLINSSQWAAFDLRNRLLEKVTSFSFDNFDNLRTGELVVRLNSDVETVRTFYRRGFFILLRTVFTLAGTIILMFLTNVRLAVIMSSIMVGVFILYLVLSRMIRPLFLRLREMLDRLNNILQENLTGAKLVRALSRQRMEEDKFRVRNREYLDLSIRTGVILSVLMPFIFITGNFAMIVVWVTGASGIPAGELTFGELTAFTNYAMMAVWPIMMLSSVLNFIIRASASAERINEVLSVKSSLAEQEKPVQPEKIRGAVAFENVSFRYGEGEDALCGINLSIAPGEKIGIIGPTAAGKSSLIHLIPRFYDPAGGRVLLDGVDLRELSLDTVRSSILAALQETVLFSGTLAENIRFGTPGASMDEVREAARLACAERFILEKPNQWDELIGERGTGLSGGQRQRIALARLLLVRPRIMILDDITSALDSGTEREVIRNLYSLPYNPTVIIVSQKINSVKRADRIYVMDDGRIIAEGSHRELMKECGLYREIDETQNSDRADFDTRPGTAIRETESGR